VRVNHETILTRAVSGWRSWIALALCIALFFIPIGHDSVWQIWVGRQMLHGARLYTDILEVNPPLLYWLAMIQAIIAELIGARLGVIVFCLALIGISLSLTPAPYRIPVLLAATILPLADFGKAEDLTLIFTMPYVFLTAARMEGDKIRHPWTIGFLAALGFAMKPWFILVPLSLELLVKPRLRPENLALGISAVAYAAAVLLFAPTYLTDIVPLLIEAYGSFKGSTYPIVMMVGFLIMALGLTQRRLSSTGLALATAAVAFLPAVLIEAKWWPYQTIPARGFLFLAVTTELMRKRTLLLPDALFASAAILCFYPLGLYRNEFRPETDLHLQGIPNGASIAVLSTNPSMAWPMVTDNGLRWHLSQLCLWQLPASSRNPVIEFSMKKRLAQDLRENPDLLVLDRRPQFAERIKALLPKHYLDAYRLKLRTRHMESYVKAH
jgi:hypothetical protein